MRTMIFAKKVSGAFGAAKMINANDDFALNFSKSSMVFLKKLLTPQCFVSKSEILNA